jgi:tetratricopeptide (TPR) repeat protein
MSSLYGSLCEAYQFSLESFMYDQALFYALRIISDASESDPSKKSFGFYAAGKTLFLKQEYKSSVSYLSKIHPDLHSVESRYLLGRSLFELEKFEEAFQLLVLNSDHAPSLHYAGVCTERLNGMDNSVGDFYVGSLKANFLMWESFCRLSTLLRKAKNTFVTEIFRKNLQTSPRLQSQQPSSDQLGSTAFFSNLIELLRYYGKLIHASHSFASFSEISNEFHSVSTPLVTSILATAAYHSSLATVSEALMRELNADGSMLEGCLCGKCPSTTALFSSVLFLEKRELELAQLAATSHLDQNIVTGNCFALQNEPDLAIKYFRRAIQLNITDVYSYFLLSLELIKREKLDKAMEIIERGLYLDSNAYFLKYAKSLVLLKQEEHDASVHYLKEAITINPNNSNLKMLLFKQEADIRLVEDVLQSQPDNIVAMVAKAECLLNDSVAGQTAIIQAKQLLEKAKSLAPKESQIHMMLGRCFQMLGEDTAKILLCFDTAMELEKDTKEGYLIKAMIENLIGNGRDGGTKHGSGSAKRGFVSNRRHGNPLLGTPVHGLGSFSTGLRR